MSLITPKVALKLGHLFNTFALVYVSDQFKSDLSGTKSTIKFTTMVMS
jgi:hypothetical protein